MTIPCHKCGGTGVGLCKGSKCGRCHGTKLITVCDSCGGAGLLPGSTFANPLKCTACGGNGK